MSRPPQPDASPAPEGLLGRAESDLYTEWKRRGKHWEEYGAEFLLTTFSVFCVVGVVAWMFGQSSPVPHAVPSHALRLLLTGLLLGGVGWLTAISPPGRLSGAHANPAVSLGFWVLGKMHARDFAGYVAGQMPGAALGGILGSLVFGRLARQVHDAALSPGPAVGPLIAFLAEIGATFALTFLVYTCVSHKALMRWTPAAAMVAVGLLVWLDGSVSGGGMNPARWFGPAAAAPDWRLAWVYLLGPLLGAAGAAGLRRTGVFTHPVPHTGKMYHDSGYRSVFRYDHVPTTPPASVRSAVARSGAGGP
ncbi:MAG: aquaporin [Armatimonadota bacterium]|nr:aquaporin [Armatimonadota bacterium]